MSYLVVCDACGKRRIAEYGEDGFPKPPSTWHEFSLADWKAHGCSSACFEKIKTERTEDPTPTTPTGLVLPG